MSLKSFVTFWIITVAFFALLLPHRADAQMVDLNGNGMDDIWEWYYSATNLPPNGDLDGDGVSNLNESKAGTDPFDPSSVPRLSPLLLSTTNAFVSMQAQWGKLYQLQSITNLDGTNWLTETSTVVRSGTSFTFPSPVSTAGKFYRVLISDVDTDGSGLNDWEKYKLGLDPSNAWSNATLDVNGNPLTDYQYVVNQLAQQNVITIAATDPVTTEPDPGQTPTDLGMYTITRGGFALNTITVNLLPATNAGCADEGVDHMVLPRSLVMPAGVSSATVALTPLANSNLFAPLIAQLMVQPGANYIVGTASNASVVVYPSPTAKGTGLYGQYFTNSSPTYSSTNNFRAANLITNRIDPAIDFTWVGTNSLPNLSNGLYTVRWTGQIQPPYTETYYFDVYSDDGCILWVNDQMVISNWVGKSASDVVGSIALQAGTRYDIRLDYLQSGGSAQAHLFWYSTDLSRQVIASSFLYPTNNSAGASSNGLPAITSSLTAVGFVGQPFSFTVTAANQPAQFTATNLPPGLVFNLTNGLISGTPTLAGNYSVPLTASNAAGLSAAALEIVINNLAAAVSREVWTNAPGVNISDIPVNTPANLVSGYGSLEGITNFGDNYGERVRGYFTAPATGNYYFWIAGSDSAQLWISDDAGPQDKILRCWVTPTNNPTANGQNGTLPRQWNLQARQQSGWLALTAGQQYYLEVLHKAGVNTNDNWAVGWLQDPYGTNTLPAGITPSYLLSRYFTPLPATIAGTLYSANMLALPGAISTAVGSATLRLSADGSQAVLNYSVSGIAGTHVDHIYSDPYLTYPSTLVFDIAAATPQSDGSYLWNLAPSGSFSTADIQEALSEGKCNIVIQTAAYPAGEIGGHFTLANGSQTFTPPPAPPAWTDDSGTTNGAVRFLTQATFGATAADIATVQSIGYSNWINNQLALPVTRTLGIVVTNRSADPTDPYPSTDWFNAWWQNAVTAPDQLRQRVAFALSEIMVVSQNGTLLDHADALSSYYDTLLTNSFGNFRALLEAVTLTPAMGLYLNMQGNAKGNLVNGTHANENYAREINQLFSVGLNRLWPDGSLILSCSGNLEPTYTQPVVSGFAQAFTGWNYFQTNGANGRLPTNTFYPPLNYTNPMTLYPLQHDLNAKLLLDNVMLPAAWGIQTNTLTTNFDNYGLQDLEKAMDAIYYHPNVGPFICRQLIQRLVTSNPSRGYLYRVVSVFNDNGSGVRGDMSAVIKAILLDDEARDTNLLADPTYGKQREPLLRVTATARAFPAPPSQTATYTESGSQTISITTPAPHLMDSGDDVQLYFTDTSGNPAPPSQTYGINWTGTNTFTVTCPNLLTGTYAQSTNTITVSISNHGLAAGNSVYLVFTTGSALNGLYVVQNVVSTSVFTVSTGDNAVRSGGCLLPKIGAAGLVQSGTNITVSCAGPHELYPSETIYIPANTDSLPPGQYQVASVPDPLHFTFVLTNVINTPQSSFNLYPLGPPSLTRSGNVLVQWDTWNMGYTDNGSTASLSQSPLNANTVFNFYYPNYAFPGALASAGVTTPEFQLTSDTGVALQMNFLESGILSNTGNTNGLSSFTSGNGAIVLDIAPWMTTNNTSAVGIPGLVDNLNALLLAGQLNAAAKTAIVNYVTNTANLGYSTPPTQGQIRDRVRAVVHLLIDSPDFTIQK